MLHYLQFYHVRFHLKYIGHSLILEINITNLHVHDSVYSIG